MIAVQTAANNAVTTTSKQFEGITSTCGFQYGLNSSGIYLLNTGEDDDGQLFERTFTLATTDLGVHGVKTFRYIYVGITTDNKFTVSLLADGKRSPTIREVSPQGSGLQIVKIPVGSDAQGRSWALTIKSNYSFHVDSIDADVRVRPTGRRGI